ncbi:MAG: DUF1343 domain-containing protein [Planctomycetaceae bacterium]
MTHIVRTGLEACVASPPAAMTGARLGLLMNQASVDRDFRYACDVQRAIPRQLRALFSPQHGLWGEQQANMIESPDTEYKPLGLPVHSLYSETRRPAAEILDGIDCLLIDLQDVGARVYTFVWTMLECLHACADNDVAVVVLDRPNPLGGEIAEGPMLQNEFRSFVGNSEIPLRHGLTIGELARLFNAEHQINADLTVVPMTGWRRAMLFPDTGLPWVPPSPNMPHWKTTVLYPGQVLLEGTNLSEGRGTTLPFEVVGAPWLEPETFQRLIGEWQHPGIRLQPIRFQPTFDKWSHTTCAGVLIHVVDPPAVRSVRLTVSMIAAARLQAPEEFRWLAPGYEYEFEKPPIDILFGNDRLRSRLAIDEPLTTEELDELLSLDATRWRELIAPYLLYQ